jgi:hypothetical protein
MPLQTKLPDCFFRVTREDRGISWVNLSRANAITTMYHGRHTLGGFSIEMAGGEESSFTVVEPEEVRALMKLLDFHPPNPPKAR